MSSEEANEIVRESQRLWRSRRALKIMLPTAAALGAGAAIAVGSIPDSNGVITGCYATPNPVTNTDHLPANATINGVEEAPGTLRIIDPSQPKTIETIRGQSVANPAATCDTEQEKQVTWNQRGPQGPPGEQGATGTPGANGASGANGGQGAPGTPGTPLIGDTTFGLTNNSGKTFLKIDGIDGESTDSKHKGDIDIESFSLGAQANVGSSGSGAGAGKATIQTFTITKALDSASPLLFQAAGQGKVLKSAVLDFAHKLKGSEQNFLEYKFANVIVSSVSDGQTVGGTPTEQVTFTFQKIEETFLNGTGKNKTPETVSWNVTANKLE